MEEWAKVKNSFRLVWRCHQLLFGFIANGHLLRLSHRSRLSANDDDEMIPEAVHRSPDIYLIAEENPGKSQIEELVDGCATSQRLKWGSLPPNNVCRIVQHVKNGKGKKGR